MQTHTLDLPEGLNPTLAKVLREQASEQENSLLAASTLIGNGELDTMINVNLHLLTEIKKSFAVKLDEQTAINSRNAKDNDGMLSFVSMTDILTLYTRELHNTRLRLVNETKTEELEQKLFERVRFISTITLSLYNRLNLAK